MDMGRSVAGCLIQLNSYGEVRSCSFGYKSVSSPKDQSYFDEKFAAYIEKKENQYADDQYSLTNYTYDVRYEQIGNKLYGLYNVTFEFSDGSFWCELVGFTKTADEEATREE